MNECSIQLREWETRSLETGANELEGLRLPDDPGVRRLVQELDRTQRLTVRELRQGIEITSTSYVGRVQLGPISITVQPKIAAMPLMTLLRYGYGLRDISFTTATDYAEQDQAFQDLVIEQLCFEVSDLVFKGLHREYEATNENLASPRGRIDFSSLARRASATAMLPCTHYPRVDDTLLNRVVTAGLQYAVGLTEDIELRARLRGLSAMIGLDGPGEGLNAAVLHQAMRAVDRRTRSYGSILLLIELLYRASGVSLDAAAAGINLNGMLFDMNRLFQRVLSRLLQESLEGYEITDEQQLSDLFQYDPAANPLYRKAPRPRPDFVVRRSKKVVSVLDAKYRDLWETPLPRGMLYQLALYALSFAECREAAIVYPTLSPGASTQRILMHEPLYGQGRATVSLRPLNLTELAHAIQQGNEMLQPGHRVVAPGQSAKERLARWVAFAA